MNPQIDEILSLLAANEASGSTDILRKSMTELHRNVASAALSRGYPEELADAIFSYVTNHHPFELDSIETVRRIVNTVLEMVCPLATDDGRSKELLLHLDALITRRLHKL